MGTLFISHSSKDNERAIFVRDWLSRAGWGDVFLDLDPVTGLAPGQHWQAELRKAGERCAAVIVLVSPNWLASDWCRTEFLLAAQLGKLIFPVLIAPVAFDALPLELKSQFQVADISDASIEAEGLERFRIGLQRAGLHPEDFPWPPPGDPMRSPYRGLGMLERCDAAVFFGREAAITKGLDTLRQMADGTPERVLVVLGASGAGKSSFLQAGLLSRLERDTSRFSVLPTVRPGRAALHGPKGLLASLGLSRFDGRDGLSAILNRMREAAPAEVGGDGARPITLVIPVDQAEELLDGSVESAAAMGCLSDLVTIDAHVLLILTLRTDRFADLQMDGVLGALSRRTFDLPPLPAGAFKQIVEAPGALADPPIEIEPALTDRLLNDLGARDALPLLAFTLDWMLKGGRRQLALDDYERELGGLAGAIERAVSATLSEAVRDPSLPDSHGELESLIRQLFLPWLVQVDEAGGLPQRRVAMMDELPTSARPLLVPLVTHRLLITRDDGGRATVEVVHEAVLRHWPALARWIDEDRGRLAAVRAVQRAAQDWVHCAPDEDQSPWLIHRGERLSEAEHMHSGSTIGALLDETDLAYLRACRAEEDRRVAERAEQAARERAHLARQRQQQRRVSIALGFIGVLIAAFGTMAFVQTRAASEQMSLVLADYSRKALAEGDATRAMRLGLLAAQEDPLRVPASTARPALAAAAQSAHLIRDFAGHTTRVREAGFSADETRMATADDAGEVRLWDLVQGRFLGGVTHGGNTEETHLRFSPDGRRLASWGQDGSLVIRDTEDGQVLARKQRPTPIWDVAISSETDRLLTRESGGLTLWRLSDGAVLSHWAKEGGSTVALFDDQPRFLVWNQLRDLSVRRLGDGEPVFETRLPEDILDAVVLPGGRRILVVGISGRLGVLDAATGVELITLASPERGLYLAGSDHGTRLAYSDDGRHLALFVNRDSALFFWHLDDPTRRVRVELPRPIYRVAWSHDGRLVATWGDSDAQMDLWRTDTGARVGGQSHDRGVGGVAFSRDDERILTWGRDGVARLSDVASGKEMARFKHEEAVWGAQFSRDEARIYSWDRRGLIEVWGAPRLRDDAHLREQWRAQAKLSMVELTGENGEVTRHGQGASVRGLHELGRTQGVVSWGYDGRVQQWDARPPTAIWDLPEGGRAFRLVDGSPLFVMLTSDDALQVWDRVLRKPVSAARRGLRLLDVVAWDKGLKLLVSSGGKDARIWTTTDDVLGPEIALPSYPRQAWLTETGARFLFEQRVDAGSEYTFADASGATLGRFQWASGAPVQMSRDGRRALMLSGNEVRMVDVETGQAHFEYRPEGYALSPAVMSGDGSLVLVVDKADISLWSAAEGSGSRLWRASHPDLNSARFISASIVLLIHRDGRVAMRRANDGALMSSFQVDGAVSRAMLSPGGGQLITWGAFGYDSKNLRVWDLKSGTLLARALQADSVSEATLDGDAASVAFSYGIGDSLREADFSFAFAADQPALAASVCATQFAGSDGPTPGVRRISEADVAFAPVLAGRVGEDVCD